MRALPDFADDVIALFTERGAEAVDVPVLQPADPFLDTAGEDLRRRIFLTASETGESLCLRPEFTIPVCLRHIAFNTGTPRRYAYLGHVFRQRRGDANEFLQSGIEDLGDTDFARADARAVADATATLSMLLPNVALDIVLGDQAVFEAVVATLGLPAGWQTRLIRAFGDHDQLANLLDALARPRDKADDDDSEIATLARAGSETALAERLEERMRETGYLSHASRTPAEIARRTIARLKLSEARLDERSLSTLREFLAIDEAAEDAPAKLRAFATDHDLDLTHALNAFDHRLAALQSLSDRHSSIRYRAAFGRSLDYYTGLVFEIASGQSVLAGGGRYDRLLTLLGAKTAIPAVGFSLWMDRIETVRLGPGAQS